MYRLFFIASFFGASAFATHREFQFENDRVIAWKTIINPFEPLKMHRHDHARIVFGIKGGSLKKIESTGEESILTFETGKAVWLDKDPEGTLHADINEGTEPIEVLVIQMKHD